MMISFFIKRLFNFSVIYLFFSADMEEICQSQPVYASSLPEKDTQSNHNETGDKSFSGKQAVSLLVDNEKFIRTDPEKKTSFTNGTQKSRNNRVRRGMMAGPIANTTKVMKCLFSSQTTIDPMFITLLIHHDLCLCLFFSFKDSHKRRLNRKLEASETLLRKDEENGQSVAGLLVTGLNQRSLECEISTADLGGGQELWSVSERLQIEPCFEKAGQDIPKTKK